MTSMTVTPRGGRTSTPRQTDRRPMTPITNLIMRDTFRAPLRRPGADSRDEIWGATSTDGRWTYERFDDGARTDWSVTYVPTGQRVDERYSTLTTARRETGPAGNLLGELRGRAFTAATNGRDTDERQTGHRLLALHLRAMGADEADARCACGGVLVVADQGGRLVHVDACDECWTPGTGYEPGAETAKCRGEHVFCGRPQRVECAHACADWAKPNRGTGCGRDSDADCCTVCCWAAAVA